MDLCNSFDNETIWQTAGYKHTITTTFSKYSIHGMHASLLDQWKLSSIKSNTRCPVHFLSKAMHLILMSVLISILFLSAFDGNYESCNTRTIIGIIMKFRKYSLGSTGGLFFFLFIFSVLSVNGSYILNQHVHQFWTGLWRIIAGLTVTHVLFTHGYCKGN